MFTYPQTRLRRNRKAQWVRDLVAETNLSVSDFIMPLFVVEGEGVMQDIPMMPDVFRYSIDKLIDKVRSLSDMGICAIMLFPYIQDSKKTQDGDEALNEDNLICRAIKAIKTHVPEIGVIADVALDPYTNHGHDGILNDKGDVDNDETIEKLCEQALVLANAGADAVAPSDMMDGRIAVIREILEASGFHNTQIFSYSAKFHSSFYTPFRDAIGSKNTLAGKNKKSYFLDYRNALEASAEVQMDVAEGADAIIIKPGSLYLDIIQTASKNSHLPVFAYHVSGEYAMLKAAIEKKIVCEREALLEVFYSFKRAGARGIITYHAESVARYLK